MVEVPTRTLADYLQSLSPGGSGAVVTQDLTIRSDFVGAAQAVPTGGTTGQVLTKVSNADNDVSWQSDATSGTVTAVSVATANGFAGTSNGDPSAPEITLTTTLGSGQIPVSNGTGFAAGPVTGAGNIVLATSPTLVTPALGTPSALVGTNITGTAAGLTAGNVTTNANLTGPITSVGNATSVASQTGTGSTFVMNTSPTLVTPNIGTPSAGVATNLTGLPLSTGVTGQLPLANGGTGANLVDPNADRVMFWDDSAGAVTWLTMGSNLTITGTTLDATGGGSSTNFSTTASTATLTPDVDTYSGSAVTAQAAGLTIAAPTGTPTNGEEHIIRIRDNGTTRALTWNAIYNFYDAGQKPAATVVGKTLYVRLMYNSATTTWDVVGGTIAGLWG